MPSRRDFESHSLRNRTSVRSDRALPAVSRSESKGSNPTGSYRTECTGGEARNVLPSKLALTCTFAGRLQDIRGRFWSVATIRCSNAGGALNA